MQVSTRVIAFHFASCCPRCAEFSFALFHCRCPNIEGCRFGGAPELDHTHYDDVLLCWKCCGPTPFSSGAFLQYVLCLTPYEVAHKLKSYCKLPPLPSHEISKMCVSFHAKRHMFFPGGAFLCSSSRVVFYGPMASRMKSHTSRMTRRAVVPTPGHFERGVC